MMRRLPLLGLALLLSTQALAEPKFARFYKAQYGYVPSCNACHRDGGGSDLNRYGEDYKRAGSDRAAFAKIAELDSDGDDRVNALEADARANPGHDRSTPANPGDWLETANLIPRAVQKQFPGVTAYKPVDAILTAKEIARAAEMGVEFTRDDENTIYVPIQDRRPVGTAIIVPANWQQEQFFVLVTTDRQLAVSSATPLHAREVSGADDASLYAHAEGRRAEELPAGDTDSLAGAVQRAIKRAATLIHVRLKSS